MSTWSKISLLDSASPTMEQMNYFHDHTMMILTVILTVVGYMMMILTFNNMTNKYSVENQTLETLWTIIPAIILIFIALPSLKILYLTDEMEKPSLTLKTIGHQWYWSYEYPDFNNKEFDSYMMQMEKTNQFRLLDVDNLIALPLNTMTRLIVTATDVIHAWTIPAMGVKMDAMPGRLNQMNFLSKMQGTFFGQCSEICGANHSFMPIKMEIIPMKNFIKWMNNIQ